MTPSTKLKPHSIKFSPQTVEMLKALTPEQLEQAISIVAKLLVARDRNRRRALHEIDSLADRVTGTVVRREE